jgi:hypothetical protein
MPTPQITPLMPPISQPSPQPALTAISEIPLPNPSLGTQVIEDIPDPEEMEMGDVDIGVNDPYTPSIPTATPPITTPTEVVRKKKRGIEELGEDIEQQPGARKPWIGRKKIKPPMPPAPQVNPQVFSVPSISPEPQFTQEVEFQ